MKRICLCGEDLSDPLDWVPSVGTHLENHSWWPSLMEHANAKRRIIIWRCICGEHLDWEHWNSLTDQERKRHLVMLALRG